MQVSRVVVVLACLFLTLKADFCWVSVSAVPTEGRPGLSDVSHLNWLHSTLVCFFFGKSLGINLALIFLHLQGNMHGSASSSFSSQMVLNLHCGFVIFDC